MFTVLSSQWFLAFVVFGICLPLTLYGVHRYQYRIKGVWVGALVGVAPLVLHTLMLRLLV